MKVRVKKPITIDGTEYLPSPEILDVWPTAARRGIISGQLEDIEGNFLAEYKAKQAYIEKMKKHNEKGNK